MTEKEKKNDRGRVEDIVSKIQTIQSEIKELVRTEKISFSKGYKFFNELQVLELLKPFLKKHKLAILMSDDPTSDLFFQQVGGNQWLVKYLKKLEIMNVKNDDEITMKDVVNYTNDKGSMTYKIADESKVFSFWAIGTNSDPAKAKGAADTYACKYILSKLFLIPVIDEDDPDYKQQPVIEKKVEPKWTKPNESESKSVITEEQVKSICDLFAKVRGEDDLDKQRELLNEFDKIMVKYLPLSNLPTEAANFRSRLKLLSGVEFQNYWNYLQKQEK